MITAEQVERAASEAVSARFPLLDVSDIDVSEGLNLENETIYFVRIEHSGLLTSQ